MSTHVRPEQLHTCAYCQTLEVDPGSQVAIDRSGALRPPVPVRYRGTKVLQGASSGCLFFKEALGILDLILESYSSTVDDSRFRPENWIYELLFHYHHYTDCIESATGRWSCVKGELTGDVQRPRHEHPRYIVAAPEDNPAAEEIVIRPFVHDFKKDESAMWAKARLSECDRCHSKCASPSNDFTPSRLLRIEQRDHESELNVRLQSLPSDRHEPLTAIRYATLSYCWGGPQDFQLNKHTAMMLTLGIPATNLPKTLSDAVDVAWDLGLSWIWIDSLCIVQDDEEERAAEVARMHLIYQYSFITLSASRAVDCHQGFLQRCSLPFTGTIGYMLPFTSPCGRLGSVILCRGDATSPVEKRSWTLQEHLLARRVLRYTNFQLHWSCAESAKHETNKKLSLPSVHWRKLEKAYSLYEGIRDIGRDCERWMTLVEEYTTRHLTNSYDTLPAMSGVAEYWDPEGRDMYLAGLWRSHLPLGLLWTSAQPHLQQISKDYRAPSWTWASRDGQVDWLHESPLPADPKLNIRSCFIQPMYESAPYGAVKTGFLKVQGYLEPAVLSSGGWPPESSLRQFSQLNSPKVLNLDLALTHIDDWNAPVFTTGYNATIHALQICPYSESSGRGPWGLVLVTEDQVTYKRIGVFDFQPPQEEEVKETDNFVGLRRHWADRKKEQQRAFRNIELSTINIV